MAENDEKLKQGKVNVSRIGVYSLDFRKKLSFVSTTRAFTLVVRLFLPCGAHVLVPSWFAALF